MTNQCSNGKKVLFFLVFAAARLSASGFSGDYAITSDTRPPGNYLFNQTESDLEFGSWTVSSIMGGSGSTKSIMLNTSGAPDPVVISGLVGSANNFPASAELFLEHTVLADGEISFDLSLQTSFLNAGGVEAHTGGLRVRINNEDIYAPTHNFSAPFSSGTENHQPVYQVSEGDKLELIFRQYISSFGSSLSELYTTATITNFNAPAIPEPAGVVLMTVALGAWAATGLFRRQRTARFRG